MITLVEDARLPPLSIGGKMTDKELIALMATHIYCTKPVTGQNDVGDAVATAAAILAEAGVKAETIDPIRRPRRADGGPL